MTNLDYSTPIQLITDPFTEEEKQNLSSTFWMESQKELRASVIQDTSHMVHEFTHVGDTKEHDPEKIQFGFKALTASSDSARSMLSLLLHPEISEESKAELLKTMFAFLQAGIVAVDLTAYNRQAGITDDPVATLIKAIKQNLDKGDPSL